MFGGGHVYYPMYYPSFRRVPLRSRADEEDSRALACLGVFLGLQGFDVFTCVLGLQGFETAENDLVDARCAFGNVYVGEGALKQLSSLSPHSFVSIGFLQ
jgi:hypothetical protein